MSLVLILVLVCRLQESSQSSFVVGIAYRFDASLSPFCAGTLVADRWVVTSASCVSSDRKVIKKGKLVVGFGANGQQDISRVSKVIKHKDYSQDKGGSTLHGNIALLKLANKVNNSRYKSACIPAKETYKYQKKTSKQRKSSKDLKLLGWRLNVVLPGALSDKLQQRSVKLGKCKGKISKRLCISTASCEGDYGGPLIQGKQTLLGVSITDMQVCKKYHGQSVFTDISRYSKWIAKKIANNGGEKLC